MLSCSLKNNKLFYNRIKGNNSYFLCYILNEPSIINPKTLNSNEYNYIKFFIENDTIPFSNIVFYKNSENFVLIKLIVRPIEFYMTNTNYKERCEFREALKLKPPVSNDFMSDYFVIYFTYNKTKKNYYKQFINSYKYKKLVLFDYCYNYQIDDSTRIIYSFESFNHNRFLKYNNLIKTE